MTLKQKIAEYLYNEANPMAWEDWNEIDYQEHYLTQAEEILALVTKHFGLS